MALAVRLDPMSLMAIEDVYAKHGESQHGSPTWMFGTIDKCPRTLRDISACSRATIVQESHEDKWSCHRAGKFGRTVAQRTWPDYSTTKPPRGELPSGAWELSESQACLSYNAHRDSCSVENGFEYWMTLDNPVIVTE